ncbi:hypothetical protein BJX68DRAFT_238638 [Aspergillus pseudodeflectus]|uniref:Uncharacterized protein n=1 Tax=Aspergillus pseudodeflectus TaxID=176178 RepID=A0ABR4K8Y8_9EURO
MQLFKTIIIALATLLPLALTQSVPVPTNPVGNGLPCSSGLNGAYHCSNDRSSIQICDNGTWRTSALCGLRCCDYNSGNALPYCYC